MVLHNHFNSYINLVPVNPYSYRRVCDALLLLKLRNNPEKDSPGIDSSCISVELLNKLIEWGYVEYVDGNQEIDITEKGQNIIKFNRITCVN